MARIRSVHPGQWTDEAFVACGAFARLLALGLRNEADDDGIFEWKPVTLKMRLFPNDAVDLGALLSELVATDQIIRFEMGGKSYGAIRNFCLYQRPKKPNPVHPKPETVLHYIGKRLRQELGDTEAVENQLPTAGEKAPQMKEEGGRMEEEEVSIPLIRKNELEVVLSPVFEEIPDPPDFLLRVKSEPAKPQEPKAGAVSSADVDEAFDAYDAFAREHGLPETRVQTAERRKRIKRFLAEYGRIGWDCHLRNVGQTPFLLGKNDRGWKADFDFITRPSAFARIEEGYYKNQNGKGRHDR